MKNAAVDTLLYMLDQCFNKPAWHGPHLSASIRGVTAKQAVWRPQPKRHNIAEQVLHTAYWKYGVRRRLRGDKRGSFPLKGSNWFPVKGKLSEDKWNEYQQLLNEQHDVLRYTVADLAKAGRKALTARQLEMISGIAAHDVYHAGQIRLLRSMVESKGK